MEENIIILCENSGGGNSYVVWRGFSRKGWEKQTAQGLRL